VRREDIRRLLGGYATGTLSDAERKAFFEAAMDDQSLFDAIADDAALKELLDDPEAREYLLAALPDKPKTVVKRMPAWSWSAVGSVAAAVLIGVFMMRAPAPQKPRAPQLMASSPLRADLDVPPVAGVETRLKVAKQKAVAPPLPRSKSAEVEVPAPDSASVALTQPVPGRLEADKRALKLPVAKEIVSPTAQVENRVTAEPSESVDAVRAQPAAAPAESATVSTAAARPAQLLDRTAEAKQDARQLFYAQSSVGGFIAGSTDAPLAKKRAAVPLWGGASLRYTWLRRQQDGSYAEADPTTVFHAGDAVRLSVESNSAGYLAVWNHGAQLANLSVLARTKYIIPAEGAIELDGPPGDKKLLVVFSRVPQSQPPALEGQLLVQQSAGRAIYVADPRPDPRISFEITLSYR
jgi:hypothetical protein